MKYSYSVQAFDTEDGDRMVWENRESITNLKGAKGRKRWVAEIMEATHPHKMRVEIKRRRLCILPSRRTEEVSCGEESETEEEVK